MRNYGDYWELEAGEAQCKGCNIIFNYFPEDYEEEAAPVMCSDCLQAEAIDDEYFSELAEAEEQAYLDMYHGDEVNSKRFQADPQAKRWSATPTNDHIKKILQNQIPFPRSKVVRIRGEA